jgi:hypothetical protein
MDDGKSDCVFEQLGRCDAQYFFRYILLQGEINLAKLPRISSFHCCLIIIDLIFYKSDNLITTFDP